MLATLGLDPAAEAVYRAMLARPRDGVAGLCGAVGLPEAQVRSALDTLSELALVRPSYELDGALRAVSPDVGMEILMARQQAELAAQQQRIEASRVAAAQLIADFSDLRPAVAHPGVEHLVGLDAIRDRLASLTREVKDEVMTFAPDGGHTQESIEAARPLDEELLGRGVKIRTVYLDSVRNSAPTVAYTEWLAARGGRVRIAPSLPTRMIVVDRATAVIPVNGDDTAAAAVVLTGHGTLTALCALFENVWDVAQPLGGPPSAIPRASAARSRPPSGCSPRGTPTRRSPSGWASRRGRRGGSPPN